ncbi:MAG: low molecular weight phosphotyrosine protein phosphatase, partial [Eudoraea sp.]|nr:low molecular weight phosphotyrosine protein phosphatase [Eudoraea sp.]
LDISYQRCRKFEHKDFDNFDVIYAMDRSNYQNMLLLADTTDKVKKVKLLLEEVNLGTKEVPDPYYGGDQGFESVFQMISAACDVIADRINNSQE